MTTFYCADLHFGHKNVMGYDGRPFNSTEEHDEVLISNWNNVVGVDDTVYILGDLSWHKSTKTIEILKRLNGSSKILVKGNHDHALLKNQKFREQFTEITDYKEITNDDGSGLVLCHYPLLTFRNHYYGNWTHFYGHVHTTWEWDIIEEAKKKSIEVSDKPLHMINVGIMMPWIDYSPKTYTEIVEGYAEYQKKNRFVTSSVV